MDLNAFIRTADPRKVRIVKRPRAEHEGPIVTVAKHQAPKSQLRAPTSDVSAGSGGDEEVASVVGQDNVEPSVPITDNVGAEIPGPKCTKKKRVALMILAINGRTGCLALPYLPFIIFIRKALPLVEAGRQILIFVTGYVVPVMTEATTMTTIAPTVAIPADVGKDKRLAACQFLVILVSSEKTRSVLLVFYREEIEELESPNYDDIECEPWNLLLLQKDHELSDLGASSSSLEVSELKFVNQVHELETSSTDLCEKLKMYEGSLKTVKGILVYRARWLLLMGLSFFWAKCLNSTEYMEALGNAFSRAIEKGMQEGLAAGIEHGQAGRCLTDLEAYIPSAEDDFNSAVSNLRGLNFSLLQEISNKKDASTWDIMDLLRLDDAVAEALGMTDLQPDVNQLMVPVHHKQDRVVIGSQALSVALDICRGRVEKMERNLVERLPFLKDVFVSLDHPLSAEALIEPPVEVPATNVLSTVVIVPHSDPSVSVEDYENPDLVDVVPRNVTPGPEGEENIDASTGGDLVFSKLDDEARDAVL
ncbi:hypothetical protein Tco_0241820 [Tanacetum coccineum]